MQLLALVVVLKEYSCANVECGSHRYRIAGTDEGICIHSMLHDSGNWGATCNQQAAASCACLSLRA